MRSLAGSIVIVVVIMIPSAGEIPLITAAADTTGVSGARIWKAFAGSSPF
jgi:hypothetical protein